MKSEHDDPFLTRFLTADPLCRSAALGASDYEFLILLRLLLTEVLSSESTEALQNLMTAIESNIRTQALLQGPSLADELIKERREEAARENNPRRVDT